MSASPAKATPAVPESRRASSNSSNIADVAQQQSALAVSNACSAALDLVTAGGSRRGPASQSKAMVSKFSSAAVPQAKRRVRGGDGARPVPRSITNALYLL